MSRRLGRPRPLRDIERDLTESDPRLEALFFFFNLHAGRQKMPRTEKIKSRPRRWLARIGRQVGPASADFLLHW